MGATRGELDQNDKIYVDASLIKDGTGGGAGIVMRDHNGIFKVGACHDFAHVSVPEHVELLAYRRGLQLASGLGVSMIMLETDNQDMARVLNSKELDHSKFGSLIQDIKELLSVIAKVRVVWARRDSNRATHSLAREGCL